MTDRRSPEPAAERSRPRQPLERDPREWTTGDEPMTPAQASFLRTLVTEANESFDEGLTKADASRLIDELQRRTGRR